MSQKPFVPVIAGPTASGKTSLAVSVAAALGGEVISADSMQIYDEMRIGTARPDPGEMAGIPHHLIGFLPLNERYSVARYAADAHAAIEDILSRSHVPVICGGTGLYIDAVIDNLTLSGSESDPALREELALRARQEGGNVLLAELEIIDPETAKRLHPSNAGRIIRALELYHTCGIRMSEQLKLSKLNPPRYNSCLVVLSCRDRKFLYDRINRRVDSMMDMGLEDEARRILASSDVPTACQAIGYKELAPYIDGQISKEQAVENLKQATRRYAKRQMSWFRRRNDATVFFIDDYTDSLPLHDAVVDYLRKESEKI